MYICIPLHPHICTASHPHTLTSLYMQDLDIVRFDPALLPVQPNDPTVTISYGFPDIKKEEEFMPEKNISIIIDTPYNIRNVSGSV